MAEETIPETLPEGETFMLNPSSQGVKEYDLSDLKSHDELREATSHIIDSLAQDQTVLVEKAAMLQNVFDIMEQNPKLAAEVGEWINYNNGYLSHATDCLEACMNELIAVDQGELDDKPLSYCGAFVTVIFTNANDHLEMIDNCVSAIEDAEKDFLERINEGELDYDPDLTHRRMMH